MQRIEVFRSAIVHIVVVCIVTPCRIAGGYRRFGDTLPPSPGPKSKQNKKRQLTFIGLKGVTSQERELFNGHLCENLKSNIKEHVLK
jgi:hypothetical protein